jgi:hypothetical protein
VLCVIPHDSIIYWLGIYGNCFQYLESLIERTPDLYLHELKADLEENRGVSVDTSTVYRTLRRRGFTLKKNNFVASERVEEDRARYQIEVAENYHPEQLVFVDECAVNRLTARRPRGWAPDGCRSRRRDFFIRGTRYFYILGTQCSPSHTRSYWIYRYSILPALSLDGILHLAVEDRPYTAELFNSFVDGLLDNMNQFPGPNSVIVMDNASIHKSWELRDMIERRYEVVLS